MATLWHGRFEGGPAEALQAINVEGLLALIEQTEDQQSPAVVEPSSPIVPPPAETVEDTDISPLLVPVR